ncbi:nuclear transport factor 2 family protein [Kribbella sp. NPDC023855]|uniref:nuclear transport factor 2 family protein n=1 Tax=Kribbella sp. NPDC023855 TaxID=3154698 RepID=UPI0033C49815
MTSTEQSRVIARQYFETMAARDWDSFGALLAEDVVYELPQTAERVTGRDRLVQFNREYPGDWRIDVSRLIVDGETAAGTMNFTVGDDEMVGLVYLELTGGLISRVTDFWPEPYDAPPGREHLIEQGVSGVDRLSRPGGS